MGGVLTAIYNANIHAKRLTRKVCHVRHVVAKVTERCDPVENGCPYTDPSGERRIDGRVVHDDNVVDSVVEQCDESSDSNDGERLAGEQTEYHGRECRCEEGFVDTEEATGAAVHVECEGNCRKDAIDVSAVRLISGTSYLLDKVHPDCARERTIRQRVFDVTPVVW